MNFDINNITPDTDYLDIINNIFYQKKISNQRLSLRGFARLLKITPSQLSQIMSGKCGLSKANAVKISRCLGFTQQETEVFTHLVLIKHARSQKTKQHSVEEVNKIKGFFTYTDDLKTIQLTESWLSLVVYEYLTMNDESFSIEKISRRLDVDIDLIKKIVDQLIVDGFIAKSDTGYYKKNNIYIISDNDSVNQKIKNFFINVMAREKEALLANPNMKKLTLTNIMGVSKEDYSYVVSESEKFFKKIVEDVTKNKSKKDKVYFYNISMITPEFINE